MIAVFLPYIIFSFTFIGNTTVLSIKYFLFWQQYFNGVNSFYFKTLGIFMMIYYLFQPPRRFYGEKYYLRI
jgi:hypothetical protein